LALAAYAYAFQIYFDFSGYSDMALGLAALLGFELPATSACRTRRPIPRDFWRRWHISLSTWLRDYLYVPLGGNRRGPGPHVRQL
jgi:D-alanyl-lipoteichoic acid acyltransferase DltB (MBOAT superfamily)